MDGTCFYCLQKIGEDHLPTCVLINKKARVKMTVTYEIDVPNTWTEENIDFHRNESSWCASNAIKELEAWDDENGCLCPVAEFEVVEMSDKPFLDE